SNKFLDQDTRACSVHFDPDLRDEHGLYLRQAGLPLPSGERVGVRGNQPLDRKPPHPTPLPCGEREQAVLAAYPWLHSTFFSIRESVVFVPSPAAGPQGDRAQ